MIVFISCGKAKKKVPCAAKDLYVGSLFQKCKKWVEKRGVRYYILSAKHGILCPEDIIEPYNMTIKGKKEIEAWTKKVECQLLSLAFAKNEHVISLAPDRYTVPLRLYFASVKEPLKNLGLGERMQALSL